MPEYTGSTDEKHVFTLPSEIERVRWLRQQAAPGGTAGLQIRTIFCAQGSQIQIRVEDAQATVHHKISGELPSDDVTLFLDVPEEAVGGLLAKVKLPNHGLSKESEALRLVEPLRLHGARWSTDTVRRGDIVDLSVEAREAQDGRRAVIRLFERKQDPSADIPFTQIRQRVQREAVQAKYRFQYPGDTADIPAEWQTSHGYMQPAFFYTVNVCGVKVSSTAAKERGVMTFVDDLTVQVVDADTGAPHTEQDVEVTLADGSTQTATTNGSGTAELTDVPPGPAKVKVPELSAPAEEPVEAPEECREEASQPAPGEPPQGTVATGAPWRVWVDRSGGAPNG